MTRSVECLGCGLPRIVAGEAGDCPRCGYVGWAPVEAVTEEMRGRLRDVPLAERRQHGRGRVLPFDGTARAADGA
jgi:hypothetical protein